MESGAGEVDDDILPLTCYATLGLLNTTEDYTAAEVQARVHRFVRFFYWTPALTHIRRELRRLHTLGYVEAREERQGRVRRVTKYRATAAGEHKLRQWAEGGPFEPAVVKNPVLLRLWLGRRAGDKERVLRFLEAHIERVESERRDVASLIDEVRAYGDELAAAAEGDEEARAEAQARAQWLRVVLSYVLRDHNYDVTNARQLLDELERITFSGGETAAR